MSKSKYPLIEGCNVVTRSHVRFNVDAMQEFQITTGQLYGYSRNLCNPGKERYGVFSYNDHWPLWVFDANVGTWFTHEAKYSRTTSQHRSLSMPSAVVSGAYHLKVDGPNELYNIFLNGYAEVVRDRIS